MFMSFFILQGVETSLPISAASNLLNDALHMVNDTMHGILMLGANRNFVMFEPIFRKNKLRENAEGNKNPFSAFRSCGEKNKSINASF